LFFPPALLSHYLKHVNRYEASVGRCDCWEWHRGHIVKNAAHLRKFVSVVSLSMCGAVWSMTCWLVPYFLMIVRQDIISWTSCKMDYQNK
jgi:hypothetical protein